MHPTIEEITRLLALGGSESYGGEAVSQLEHALQCATLAEEAESSPELITACLLHDIGHLLDRVDGESALKQGLDLRHEERGWHWLRERFGPAVAEPVRMHVEAKRYLCYTNKSYWSTLSPISKRSLELQGGVFSAHGAFEFVTRPFAPDSVQLRRWDDQAKVKALSTPDLTHFASSMESCLLAKVQ